jgi:hypothetical protein
MGHDERSMVGKRLGGFRPAAVAEAHAQFLAGDLAATAGVVRGEVIESWERSRRSVAPLLDHAPVLDGAAERWRSGRIAEAFAPLASELTQIADDGDFVAAITDETGAIVWVAGGRTMRRRAERVGFLPGGRWDERDVGTNALALALRSARPATVVATEHFAPMVHDWVCYSAPITDPATGSPAGVLDLSTTWSRANPLALTTVTALARNLEHVLGATTTRVEPALTLRTLGAGDVLLHGRRLALPPRQVEIVTLQVLHDRLHGEAPISPATTKAELSHLRASIGDHLVSRPYRLAGGWDADHLAVMEALCTGHLDEALGLYRGPLLPRSSAPAIDEHRHVLAVAVRNAVIAAPTAARLATARAAMPEDTYLRDLAERG